jgi:DNA-binding MarR family transcriptional regulator
MTTEKRTRTAYLLGRLDRLVYRALEDILRDEDITVLGYTALTVLASRPGLSNAQLARRAFMTPQGMNQALAGLAEKDLVKRTPDELNRRVLRIELTERGHQLVEGYERQIDLYEEKLLASLSDNQRDELNGMLLTIVNDNRHHP